MAFSSSLTMVALILRKIILTELLMAHVTRTGFVSNHTHGKKRKILAFCILIELVFCMLNALIVFVLQKNARVVTIDGYEDVPENDEKSLQKAVAHQPVSVAIEAGGRAFQLYESVMTLLEILVSIVILTIRNDLKFISTFKKHYPYA